MIIGISQASNKFSQPSTYEATHSRHATRGFQYLWKQLCFIEMWNLHLSCKNCATVEWLERILHFIFDQHWYVKSAWDSSGRQYKNDMWKNSRFFFCQVYHRAPLWYSYNKLASMQCMIFKIPKIVLKTKDFLR